MPERQFTEAELHAALEQLTPERFQEWEGRLAQIAPQLQRTIVQILAEGGWVRLAPAWHTSTTPKGTVTIPAGLVVNLGGKTVYHLGDTGLFSDLQLVKARDKVDVALMCIGGHYTMDRHDAVDAADFVGAKTIIPCHYDTFPAIETDDGAFQTDIEKTLDAVCVVLEPGAVHQA